MELKASKANRQKSRKPSASDLRKHVAKIKPVARHGGKRGR